MTETPIPAGRTRGTNWIRIFALVLDQVRGRAPVYLRLASTAVLVGLTVIGASLLTLEYRQASAESPCDASIVGPRAPGMPRNLAAPFVNGSFQLSWDAPSDVGKPSLSGYRVYWDPAEPPLDEIATTTGRNVPQWKGIGATHTIKVAAVNCAGSSAQASVDSLAAELPSVPRTFAVDIAGTFAVITWKSPASTGSAREITGYVLTYETGGDSTTVQLANNVFEHILSGLTPGASYTFGLAAKSAYGTGAEVSSMATIPLPDDAPRSFNAMYSGGQIVLTWRAPASSAAISGYKLRQTVDGTTTSTDLPATSVRHTVSSPTAGKTYRFRLAAVANGSEGTSVSASVTIPSLPGAPTGLSARMSGEDVAVSWSAPTTAGGLSVTGYKVSWSTSQSTMSANTAASVLRYTIDSPTPGTTLTIKVSAISAVGTGTAATVTFTVPAPPSVPTNLALTMSQGSLRVSWSPPASAGTSAVTGYALKWSYDSTTGSARVGGDSRSYTITSPVAGKAYSVALSAANSAGDGPTATASLTVPSAPGAPRNLGAQVSGSDLSVSWSAPSYGGTAAITGYSIKWKFGTPQQSGSASVDADVLTYTIASVVAGATYQLALGASNSAGMGPEATLSYTIPAPPGRPRDLDAELQSNGDFRVSWKSPSYAGTSPISKYRLTWTVGDSSSVSSVETAGLQHDITSPSLGSTYGFTLVAINPVGAGQSATLNATVPSPPGKVANLAAEMSGNGLAVSWDAPSYTGTTELSGYELSWVTGSTTTRKTLSAATTTYTIPEVVQGSAYSVTVSAKNSVGTGSGSSVQFTVPQPPGTPRNFTAKMSGGALVLSWQVPTVTGTSAITGYALSWTVDGMTTNKDLGPTVRGYSIESPGSGKAYQFSLRAVSAAGTGHNADTTFTVPQPPGAPSNLSASIDANGSLTVSWSAPVGTVTPAIKHYALSWTVTGGGTSGSVQVGVNSRTHTIASPTKGATYTFAVAGVSEAGTGPSASTSFTVPKPPGAPRDLTAAIVASGDLKVSWSAPSYLGTPTLSGYRLSWKVGETSGSAAKAAYQRSHAIRSPVAGASYSFKVISFNRGGGNSPAAVFAYTVPAVPGTPRDFVAELDSGNVKVTWQQPTYLGVPTLSAFLLTWSIRAPRTDHVTQGSATLSSSKRAHALSSVAAGSAVAFSLVARNSTGDGPAATATVTVPSVPDAPRNLDAELYTDGDLEVSWDAPDYAGTTSITGYTLSWTVGGDSTSVTTGAATTTYSITSPTLGARYDLSVKAVNSVGSSSSATNYVVVPAPPGAPSSLTWEIVSVDGVDKVRITWEEPTSSGTSSIKGYVIQYTVGQVTTTKSLAATALSYTIEEPVPGAQYAIKLSVRTDDGMAVTSLTFTLPKPPSAPREFAATLDDSGKIALSWNAPLTAGTSSISSYQLTINIGTSNSRGEVTTTEDLTAAARTHEIADPIAGKTYRFGLAAVSTAGKGNTADAVLTVPEVPGAPRSLVGEVDDDGDLVVSWSAPSNRVASALTGYELTWRHGQESGSASINDASSPRFVIDDPTPGGTYHFAVKSVGPVGESGAATLSITIPAPPGVPGDFVATVSSGELVLSWAAPTEDGTAELSGYTLSWTIGDDQMPASSGSANLDATATTHTISTPRYGAAYTLKLRAVTTDGSGPEVVLRYRVPTVPSGPLNLSASYVDGTTTISWKPPASDGGTDIAGYEVSWEPITGTGHAVLGADQLSFAVSSLQLGIVYRFALIARNAVGRGPIATLDYEVSTSGPTGKTFDDNPRRLTLDFSATYLDDVARFSWQLPTAVADDPIVRFVLSWSGTNHDHFATVTLQADAVEHALTGLRRGAEYAISLVVVRRSGTSAPVARFFTVPELQSAVGFDGVGPVSTVATVLDLRLNRLPRATVVAPRSEWLGPDELELYQMGGSMQVYWDEPDGREALGWTVDWVPGSPEFPTVLPSSTRSYRIAGMASAESGTVKVRAVYSDGVSVRTRSTISLESDESTQSPPRSEMLDLTDDFGANATVQSGGLAARVTAPAGSAILGEAVRMDLAFALMPRVIIDDRFTAMCDELGLKLEASFMPDRKHANRYASHYRLLSPMEVCLSDINGGLADHDKVASVVLATRSGSTAVLDSMTVHGETQTDYCAEFHVLELGEPMYFGLVSRDATETPEPLTANTQQSAAMVFFVFLNLIFVFAYKRDET